MPFYEYRQTNSGGVFDCHPERGISAHVIIEADSAEEANACAVGIGLYFNGVEKGYDCSCCGDRWSESWYEEGTDVPSVWGTPITDYNPQVWWVPGYQAFTHYKDGRIVGSLWNPKTPRKA